MQTLSFKNSINRIYDTIELHLCDEISIEQLANIAGFSMFHFQRRFKREIGITIHQFIRHIRLVSAAKRMVSSEENITQIAYACGYHTLQSFSREFNKEFGISPRDFRTRGEIQWISYREQLLRTQAEGNSSLFPRILYLPERMLYYVCQRGGTGTNAISPAQEAFAMLQNWLDTFAYVENVKDWVGQLPDEPDTTPPDTQRFHAGVIFQDGFVPVHTAAARMDHSVIPAGRWAVFRVKGPYEQLWQTWSAIYRDWLPSSGFSLGHASPYEVYFNSAQDTPAQNLLTDLYLPLL